MDEISSCSTSSPTHVFLVFSSLFPQMDCFLQIWLIYMILSSSSSWLPWSKPDSGKLLLLVLLNCFYACCYKIKGYSYAALSELFIFRKRVFTGAFLTSAPTEPLRYSLSFFPIVPHSFCLISAAFVSPYTYFSIHGFYLSFGFTENRICNFFLFVFAWFLE